MPLVRPGHLNCAIHAPKTGFVVVGRSNQSQVQVRRSEGRNTRGKRKQSKAPEHYIDDNELDWGPSGPKPQAKGALQKPLGIDFGKVRIGVATGQLGWLASPCQIIETSRRPWPELAVQVLDIAEQQGSDGIVVGMPVTSAGSILKSHTDSVQGRACRSFAQTLSALVSSADLPVFLYDESRTSKDAADILGLQKQTRLQQQGRLDAVAAAMLLEAYFKRPEAAINISSVS